MGEAEGIAKSVGGEAESLFGKVAKTVGDILPDTGAEVAGEGVLAAAGESAMGAAIAGLSAPVVAGIGASVVGGVLLDKLVFG